MGYKYLNLNNEGNHKLHYDPEALRPYQEELRSFLSWDQSLDNLEFAKKMLFSHELKANNQIEGYTDNIDIINEIIHEKTKDIKNTERRERILNLYKGYQYILENKNINTKSLKELYEILSHNLLDSYDLTHMGELYREAPVYILKNGRLEHELDEGMDYHHIAKHINEYFNFLNSPNLETDSLDIYIKSQILHFYFVYVHPYFDVNGRTSRTISLWYLLNKKSYPYIIFNRGLSFAGGKYDREIRLAKQNFNLTEFLKFLLITLKIELEKEHIIEDIIKTSKFTLTDNNYQTLLYFITMHSNKTILDFAKFYNNFNDKKRSKTIYEEMLLPLIDLDILKVTRFTKKSLDNLPNMDLSLNTENFDYNPNYLKRVKLK